LQSPKRFISLGMLDRGPRHPHRCQRSESTPFGSLMSPSQAISQGPLMLTPCSMHGACSIYALCLLKAHGLPHQALKIVTRATTINQILYASPAWCGYANASDKGRIQRFLDWMSVVYFSPFIFKLCSCILVRSDIEFLPIKEDNNILLSARNASG